MKVIDKIPFTIRRIVPGTVCILAGKNEVQISSRDLEVLRLRQFDPGLGQEKRSIGTRVYNAAWVIRRRGIGTTSSIRQRLQVSVTPEGMLGD